MDKFIDMITESLNDEKYDKVLDLGMLIFVLLAPSFSLIFLFKREMFYEVDLIKLLILCIIINFIGAFIMYIIDYNFILYNKETLLDKLTDMVQEFKHESENIEIITNGIEKNIRKENLIKNESLIKKLNKEINLMDKKFALKLVFLEVALFVVYIWGSYLFINFNLSSNQKMGMILFSAIIFYSIYLIIKYIEMLIKSKKNRVANCVAMALLIWLISKSIKMINLYYYNAP